MRDLRVSRADGLSVVPGRTTGAPSGARAAVIIEDAVSRVKTGSAAVRVR